MRSISISALLIFTTLLSAQIRLEPYYGWGRNSYNYEGYDYYSGSWTPSYFRVHKGFTKAIGLRVMDFDLIKPFYSVGLGMAIQQYTGGFDQHYYTSRSETQDDFHSERTVLSLIAYPINLNAIKRRLTFSFGIESDILLKEKSRGYSVRSTPTITSYNKTTFSYNSDSLGFNRKSTTGFLLRFTAKIIRIQYSYIQIGTSVFYSWQQEFNINRKMQSVRTFLELSYSLPITKPRISQKNEPMSNPPGL